jgi:6-phosphogluconolactonase (cycloisomerase 2 family)
VRSRATRLSCAALIGGATFLISISGHARPVPDRNSPAAASQQSNPLGSAVPSRGRPLYVANSAADQEPRGQGSTVARFTFDAAGPLNLIETVPACGGARGLVFTPNLQFAYLSCLDEGQIRMYRVAENGALTSIGQIDLHLALGIAIAPDGRTLYVGSDDHTLTAFRVESDGLLTEVSRVDSGGLIPRGLAVTPNGRFVYVSHGALGDTFDSVMTGFALGADGSLQGQVAEVTNGIDGGETVITPNGRFIYITAGGSDRVFGYRIRSDGSLTPVPGQSFPSGDFPSDAAISPDGRLIYVADIGALRGSPGEIRGWTIDVNGALTEVERIPTDNDPVSLVFAPDGRHLYVSDTLDDEVTAFRVSRKGKLTEIQTLGSGGADPAFQSIVILPNLGPVASFSIQPEGAFSVQRSGPRSQVRFDGTASIDPDGRVALYIWDFGDGTPRRIAGPRVEHMYGAPGTYTVRLTVIDDEGCSGTLIFTGQLASCVGSDAATATLNVVVR